MAAPDETLVFRVPGDLILAPTSSVPPAYGGTRLGLIHAARLRPITREFAVAAEEYGGETTEIVYLGRDWVVTALLRGWDPDSLGVIFPSSALVSGRRVITEPGSHAAGDLETSRAVKLLFAPKDSTHPAWLLHRALPQLEETAELRTELMSELNAPVVFRALRGSGGAAVVIGRISDITI